MFFLCSLKDLRHPPGLCSFTRVPSFRLFPVCTLKDLGHYPAVDIFRAFVPSAFFHIWSLLCVEYLLLIPDTGYTCSVPSFSRFFFRLVFVF